MKGNEVDAVRAVGAAIARDYDTLVYEPEQVATAEAIEPGPVLGLAGVYGCAPDLSADVDVLDLGCGTGAQLARAGARTRGRLVGVDLSEVATRRARERCLPFGERVAITHADFLDLDPHALGRFDLIYNVGVIFLTPPLVQQQLLEVIGWCLKPGGAALMTYYAGSLPRLREGLHRVLRAAVDPELPREEQIRRARAVIDQVANLLPATGHQRRVLMQVLDHARTQADALFFHEALAGTFSVLETSAIEAALAPHSVEFLGYMTPNAFGVLPTSRERALGADVVDFASGGSYRYAVFGKPTDGASKISARSPSLRWRSGLSRTGIGFNYSAPAMYHDAGSNADVQIVQSHTQAALDLLGMRAATWAEIWDGVRARLAGRALPLIDNAETFLEQDLIQLWQSRMITPSWEAAPSRP